MRKANKLTVKSAFREELIKTFRQSKIIKHFVNGIEKEGFGTIYLGCINVRIKHVKISLGWNEMVSCYGKS